MNRTIEYKITEAQNGLRVEQFLRRKGYSGQNLAEIKRMPKSVLVNGEHYCLPPSGDRSHPSDPDPHALPWFSTHWRLSV